MVKNRHLTFKHIMTKSHLDLIQEKLTETEGYPYSFRVECLGMCSFLSLDMF